MTNRSYIAIGKSGSARGLLRVAGQSSAFALLLVEYTGLNQYRILLHNHTTNSDGQAVPQQLIEECYRLGYDGLAITDHNFVTSDWISIQNGLTKARNDEIQSGVGRGGRGMLCIPYTNEQSIGEHRNTFFVDYNNTTPTATASVRTFQAADEQDGLVHLCHLGWSNAYHTFGEMGFAAGTNISCNPATINKYADWFLQFASLVCMEINGGTTPDSGTNSDRILWDNILKQTMPSGRNVWGFSNDDYHGNAATATSGIGRNVNVFLLPELTLVAFRNAMQSGSFYGTARVARRELGASTYTAMNPMPVIKNIVANDSDFSIETEHTNRIDWISEGKTVGTGKTLKTAILGVYVRVNAIGDGGIAFSQAFRTGRSPVSPNTGSKTTLNGAVINDAHYHTHTDTGVANDFVINSQHEVGGHLHDAYIMNGDTSGIDENGGNNNPNRNTGNIRNATVLFGTLSNNANLTNATVSDNGTLINHTGRTITGNVEVGVGGYVANEGGTVNALTMTGGSFHNNFDATGVVGTVGTNGGATDIGGTGWFYNAAGGRVLGNVTVKEHGTFEHSNARSDRAVSDATVIDNGTLYNYGVDSTINNVVMNDNSTVRNGLGGMINNLIYYGGAYFDNVNDKYAGFEKGSIGTLTLVGFCGIEETGIDWGSVGNVVIQ